MADVPPRPDSDDDPGDDSGTPRWVKVFGIIAVVLVLLSAVLMLAGHGPGRHTP